MSADTMHEPRAFFGRRKGHPLRAHQNALFDTLLPRLAVDTTKPCPHDLRDLFEVPVDDVRLEIGFGGAERLIAEAQAHPRSGFIGSDGFLNAVAKALSAIEAKGLRNIRLHHGDAAHLLAWLPDRSLARVELLYPDPWPKRRHWKRRFVQDDNLDALARVLRHDGEFRFASDIADYAAWTLGHVTRSAHFQWTAETADDWRKPWPDFAPTRYEAKARREGRGSSYLTFRRR